MEALLNNRFVKRFLQLVTGSRVERLKEEAREEGLPDEERARRRAVLSEEVAGGHLARAAILFGFAGLLRLVMRR